MRRLLFLATSLTIVVLFFSCGPKKNSPADHQEPPVAQSKPEETIFGIYNFGKSVAIAVILKEDSTAVMKNPATAKISFAPRNGIFTFHNDSIFINWDNGRQVSSKFERGDGIYSFRIGSTTYKRKL